MDKEKLIEEIVRILSDEPEETAKMILCILMRYIK